MAKKPAKENGSSPFSHLCRSYIERYMDGRKTVGWRRALFVINCIYIEGGEVIMKKFYLILFICFAFIIGYLSSKSPQQSTIPNQNQQSQNTQQIQPKKITVGELMSKNDPDVKRLTYTPADYVGKSFTLYVMAEADNYYNYGFRNENKYYSFKLWDNSVGNSLGGVYAYLDKTNPDKKAKELLDILLKENKFIKVEVSVPAEKYQESSNAFLEIDNWEIIPTE